MRIIGGQKKGKKLQSPKGMETRPTSDKMRAAMFNILQHATWAGFLHPHFENTVIFDAFAGSGALSLEALSRGAQFATMIEQDRSAIQTCKSNITLCNMEERYKIFPRDATKIGPRPTDVPAANLIFLDPPYGHNLGIKALDTAIKKGWIADQAVVLLEMDKKRLENLDKIAGIEKIDSRDYGASRLNFYLYQANEFEV